MIFFHTPMHSMPPLGGSHRNIAITFEMEKLEWCAYLMVKYFEDMFSSVNTQHNTSK